MEHHSAHQATLRATPEVNHQLDGQREACLDCCTTRGAGFQYRTTQLQRKYLILQCHLVCHLAGVLSSQEEFLVLAKMMF